MATPHYMTKQHSEARNFEVMGNWLFPDSTAFLQTIIALTGIFSGWISASVEVFLRYEFGERYLGVFRLLGGLLGMSMSIFFASMLLGLTPGMDETTWFVANAATTPLTLLYLGFALFHRYQIRQRNRAGIRWHSMSFGLSRLEQLMAGRFSLSHWTIYCYAEPALCFALGFILIRIAPLTLIGGWLQLSAIALFIHNNLLQMHQRNRMLDIIDAQIESSHFQDAVSQKPKRSTAGFTVVPAMSTYVEDIRELDLEGTVNAVMQNGGASQERAADMPQEMDATVKEIMNNGRR